MEIPASPAGPCPESWVVYRQVAVRETDRETDRESDMALLGEIPVVQAVALVEKILVGPVILEEAGMQGNPEAAEKLDNPEEAEKPDSLAEEQNSAALPVPVENSALFVDHPEYFAEVLIPGRESGHFERYWIPAGAIRIPLHFYSKQPDPVIYQLSAIRKFHLQRDRFWFYHPRPCQGPEEEEHHGPLHCPVSPFSIVFGLLPEPILS